MTCEEAENFLNARIDGELAADDAIALEAHLAECAGCRQALADLEIQDAALVRAFCRQIEAGDAVAERVIAQLPQTFATRRTARRRWRVRYAIAASIGLIGVGLALRLFPQSKSPPPLLAPQPIAQLTLATGKVFLCPTDETQWRPISPGESITPGSRIRTDSAKCELRLAGGGEIRLNRDTEACLTTASTIKVDTGQVWTCPSSKSPQPLQVIASNVATITARQTTNAPTAFEVLCAPGNASIKVNNGSADVAPPGGREPPIRLQGGGFVMMPPRPAPEAFLRLLAEANFGVPWQDDLLVLKPAGDAEVAARVAQLLDRIGIERVSISATQRSVACVGPVEQDVRSRGQAWSTPFVCYVRDKSAADLESRRTAARLLADLAPASCIPDLIELVGDQDASVRASAASALRRLTGQDFGQSPEICAPLIDPAIVATWRAWWGQNQRRYAAHP
jgi:ferric-dicitrate binding protein FerR (iron transport regulator)